MLFSSLDESLKIWLFISIFDPWFDLPKTDDFPITDPLNSVFNADDLETDFITYSSFALFYLQWFDISLEKYGF